MTEKTCSKCKITKNINEFLQDRAKKSGFHSWCKQCHKEYRQIHKEQIKEYHKHYNQIYKEQHKQSNKIYYQSNKEKINARINKYQKTHKKQRKEWLAQYRKTNINSKLAYLLRGRQSKALKGNYKSGSAVRDLGCSIEFLKQYLESLWLPGMSWDNYGKGEGKWNIDHKIALLSPDIDLTNREDYLKVSHYTNLQPMWAIDNIRKSNK